MRPSKYFRGTSAMMLCLSDFGEPKCQINHFFMRKFLHLLKPQNRYSWRLCRIVKASNHIFPPKQKACIFITAHLSNRILEFSFLIAPDIQMKSYQMKRKRFWIFSWVFVRLLFWFNPLNVSIILTKEKSEVEQFSPSILDIGYKHFKDCLLRLYSKQK